MPAHGSFLCAVYRNMTLRLDGCGGEREASDRYARVLHQEERPRVNNYECTKI